MEVNNDFLLRMDAEAMKMLMSKEFGGLDKNLSDVSFLEYREQLYKKYYIEEAEDKLDPMEISFDADSLEDSQSD